MVAVKQVIVPIQAILLVTGTSLCYTEAEISLKKSLFWHKETAQYNFVDATSHPPRGAKTTKGRSR
jgi:hypothetical protein